MARERILMQHRGLYKLTAAPVFITVHIADASAPSNSAPSDEGGCAMTLLPRGVNL
jgi:hypothetical protein